MAACNDAGRSHKAAFVSNTLLFSVTVMTVLAVLCVDTATAAKTTLHHRHHHHHHRHHHKLLKFDSNVSLVIKSSCANTRYPELCLSSLFGYSGADKLTCQKDVIFASLNMTASAVEASHARLEKLEEEKKGLSPRAETALHDCQTLMGETLDELELTIEKLRVYPANAKDVTIDHVCELKILLSGAMTNQRACVEGFSLVKGHEDIRKSIKEGARLVYRMASNALAMVANMTASDLGGDESGEPLAAGTRRLLQADDGFPGWMSAGDRKLLQDAGVNADIVVAADGSGNVRTVWEAINRAPQGSGRRFVIRVKGGVYRENVEVPASKSNIMLVGDGKGVTVITGSRSVGGGSTTFSSATFGVMGNRFIARDITFQNTAGPSAGQAVALRVGSDLSAFYRCEISGYQDTLYAYSMRQFYRDCTITGTIDFIFGNAAAVFQNCDLLARRPLSGQNNDVTAQGRSDPNQNTGFSIQNCRIGGTSELGGGVRTYLGRPWMAYSRVVVIKSTLDGAIDPAGWDKWIGTFGQDTAYYGEYLNNGPGASTQNRVRWRAFRVMTDAEAQRFTLGNFIGGANWLGSTGLPFSLTV